MKKGLFNVFMNRGTYLSFALLVTTFFVSNTLKSQYIVDFEAETSGGYASETVNLNGIDWDLTESLIGNLVNDFKNGTKSLRLRGYGTSSFTMLEDKANGIGSISFAYSEYGSDNQTSWRVEYSTDQGASWTQAGSDFTATGGNTNPEMFNETIEVTGNARIRVIEATGSGTSNRRMNIDDITLTDYVSSSPTVAATPNSLTGFTQFLGAPSAEQSFEVTGSNLTDDIELTVTNGDYLMSETSGGTFTNSLTLTQASGSVGPTTIYVVLDGTATANPSNGEITITSASATNATVVLEGQILDPDPTVFVSTNSITGFSHFVGNASAEQSFDVSGDFLTDDLVVTAPANYEVSLSSGIGFSSSVAIVNSGSVASTPIYVRLNGPAANYTQNGDIIVTSSGANTENISLEGETFDYTLYPIGAVTTNDVNGVADSIDVFVELRGIVHCIDFNANDGYNFTIIDSEGDGINIFNFNSVDGYVVTEGDSIGVKGQIDQFNGLTQIFAEEITLFSQGNATETPLVVSTLAESTESQLVTLENLTLVDGEATWPNNGNINVTNGTATFTVRVTSASPLSGTATPNGAFNITGLGGQFDNSLPYDQGYQLFPCSVTELCNVDVSTTLDEITISAGASGVDYQWVDCTDNYAPITGETNQDFTAIENGSYAVIITDGTCVDTSACVEITTVSVSSNTLSHINLYPNPISNKMQIDASGEVIRSIEVFNTMGKRVFVKSFNTSSTSVTTSNWESGVYFVKITTLNGNTTLKVVK